MEADLKSLLSGYVNKIYLAANKIFKQLSRDLNSLFKKNLAT